jgi:hypothetical protein
VASTNGDAMASRIYSIRKPFSPCSTQHAIGATTFSSDTRIVLMSNRKG